MTAPDHGDVVWIDFDPQVGHEQGKRSPALVLSQRAFNERFGVALVCPISTQPRGHAFEAPFPPGHAVKGAVLVQHLKSLDWRGRRSAYICAAPSAVVERAADIANEMLIAAR